MVSRKNFVYSIAAARRILGNAFEIVRVERWFNVCLVVFAKCRARFMSCKAFTAHFVAWRKLQAQALTVAQRDTQNAFHVSNVAKETKYSVFAFGRNGIACNCEDSGNQLKLLGRRGCCKHGYAVLSYLGYASLSDYIAAHD